jgi:hypothetical protein
MSSELTVIIIIGILLGLAVILAAILLRRAISRRIHRHRSSIPPRPQYKPFDEVLPPDESDKVLTELDNKVITAKRSGQALSNKVLNRHYNHIANIRERYQIEDINLLSGRISNTREIPSKVKQEMANLHSLIQESIEQTAKDIENFRYKSTEQAFENAQLGLAERMKVEKLFNAEKSVHVSIQSLKITAEYFNEINDTIIKEAEASQSGGNRNRTGNLLVVNAILVFELLDFVINYLQDAHVDGLVDIQGLHSEIMSNISTVREELSELRKRANAPEIDPAWRDQTLRNIESREKGLVRVTEEWNKYLADIKLIESELNSIKGNMLPNLKLRRDDALNQIKFLSMVTIMSAFKDNTDALKATFETLMKMELAPLSAERVSFLLGMDDRLSDSEAPLLQE